MAWQPPQANSLLYASSNRDVAIEAAGSFPQAACGLLLIGALLPDLAEREAL
jgi:hypothetical protein